MPGPLADPPPAGAEPAPPRGPFAALLRLLVPLAGSLVAHAVLLIVLLFTTWTTIRNLAGGPEFSVGIVSTTGGQAFGTEWHDTPSVAGTSTGSIEADLQTTPPDLSGLLGGGADAAPTLSTPDAQGIGLGSGDHAGLLGIGSGADRGSSGGVGFGSGTGQGSGSAGVWNLSARGNRFVYVVDFSGSIIIAVRDLKRELKRSIGNLQPDQSFNVIVFYSTPGRRDEEFRIDSFAPKLQPATARNKREFFDWIDSKSPQGSTRPLSAIKRAFTMEPQAIFLFSDGVFENAVVEDIAAANHGKAQIHCLVFDELLLEETSGFPRPTEGAERLARISELSGGRTKIVTARDLD